MGEGGEDYALGACDICARLNRRRPFVDDAVRVGSGEAWVAGRAAVAHGALVAWEALGALLALAARVAWVAAIARGAALVAVAQAEGAFAREEGVSCGGI